MEEAENSMQIPQALSNKRSASPQHCRAETEASILYIGFVPYYLPVVVRRGKFLTGFKVRICLSLLLKS